MNLDAITSKAVELPIGFIGLIGGVISGLTGFSGSSACSGIVGIGALLVPSVLSC